MIILLLISRTDPVNSGQIMGKKDYGDGGEGENSDTEKRKKDVIRNGSITIN